MTTKTDEQERAEFEAACRGHVDEAGYDEEALNLTRDGDGYIDKATQAAWWGWREGRAALQSQDMRTVIEALKTAQNNECGPRRPWGSAYPDNDEYAHDAFMWDYYQRAIDHARRIEGDGK